MKRLALLEVSISKADERAQPRLALNAGVIDDYAEAMAAGTTFPPVIVFTDGDTYWLADGFHRHAAAKRTEVAALDCDVRDGGLRDAILYSVGANAAHGYRRSNNDKRRAVMRLLEDREWSKWSDHEIARRASVGQTYVSKLRRSLSTNLS